MPTHFTLNINELRIKKELLSPDCRWYEVTVLYYTFFFALNLKLTLGSSR